MDIFVSSLTILAALFAALSNRDLLSPAKLYLLFFSIFFAGALTLTSVDLWLLILLVLLVGVGTACLEAGGAERPAHRRNARGTERAHLALWIWVASLPAIAAQIYIVHLFDGIQGYINMIGNRVLETRGLGPAKTVVSTISILNLMYFAVGLTRARSRLWWSAYVFHVLLVLAIGLLSGSRGSTLTVFVMQIFVFHYVRRRVRLAHALSIAAVLLGFAVVLGVMREGLRVDDAGVTTGLDSSSDPGASLSTFFLGVQPLKILVGADDLRLAHGETLLSLVTNVIPRAWWPEKPDTGGVFFTKVYTDDAWDGASNLTPTFLGEWIMNFGWGAGIACFAVASAILMYLTIAYYRRTMAKLRGPVDARTAMDVVVYVYVLWAVVGLMVGEVTNTVQTLVTTQLIPALVLKALLTRRGGLPAPPRQARMLAPGHAGGA
ncbi:MAG TPA: O-antigen polymerase [Steroidobacteraceae bacterium]|nr:O-antigen polymerase [Steroidobacteraceae bacterium]